MLDRRSFLALITSAGISPLAMMGCTAFRNMRARLVYCLLAVNSELQCRTIDLADGSTALCASLSVPLPIQYGLVHPDCGLVYLACSNGELPGGSPKKQHQLVTLEVGAGGVLRQRGAALALPSSAVHLALDAAAEMLFITFNAPSRLSLHRIGANGLPGPSTADFGPPAIGVFAHQSALDPSSRLVIVSARGNDATAQNPEDVGRLDCFIRTGDTLTATASVQTCPNIGPRNIDFHPFQPWIYAAMERGNQIAMYRRQGDRIETAPCFVAGTLAEGTTLHPRQRAGAIRVHPLGHALYVANRADQRVAIHGQLQFAGGENSIAVFDINAVSGEPVLRQRLSTRGIEPRSFAISPDGTLLAVGNQIAFEGLIDDRWTAVPASLALFRIASNGMLTFVRMQAIGTDTSVGNGLMWVDFLSQVVSESTASG